MAWTRAIKTSSRAYRYTKCTSTLCKQYGTVRITSRITSRYLRFRAEQVRTTPWAPAWILPMDSSHRRVNQSKRSASLRGIPLAILSILDPGRYYELLDKSGLREGRVLPHRLQYRADSWFGYELRHHAFIAAC
jgi:hypothetical protein